MMLEFNSIKEAREWGMNNCPDNYAWQKVKINGKNCILCSDCRVYEDELYGFLMEYLDNFGFEMAENDLTHEVLSVIEKHIGYAFADIFTEF